eukprot:Rhum_TRINITY_DN13055_c0_g1::Rhum_TRINITY_DN13055_c0_g1_i1::g.56625::m.56625
MKPDFPPLFVDAPVLPDSIPKTLLNESFRCLEKSGQCYCFQVVEKVHSRGGVDERVLIVQHVHSANKSEFVVFLCTLDGRVRKFFPVRGIMSLVVIEIEEAGSLLKKKRAPYLQVLIKHATEPEILVNLVHHRLNNSHHVHRVLSVLNRTWKKENGATQDIPVTDLRGEDLQAKDLRSWVSRKKDGSCGGSVRNRASQYLTSPNTSTSGLEKTVGYEEMDITYGGERMQQLVETGVAPPKKIEAAEAQDQGDLGHTVEDTAAEEDIEALMRGLTVAS